jgi:hypothetical protein
MEGFMQSKRSNTGFKKYSSLLIHMLMIVTMILAGLFVGGDPSSAVAKPASTLPVWYHNAIWHQLDSGVTGSVKTIVRSGTDYYVGGYFENAGGIEEADYLARWDGNAWYAVTSSPPLAAVNAIAIDGTKIYVGGAFDNIGGDSDLSRIAYWDTSTSTWHEMDGGLNDSVMDMVIFGGYLYVGGTFTDAGSDTSADYIARWNGSSWDSIGGSLGNTVQGLAAYGGKLYVGGDFLDGGSGFGDRVRQFNIAAGTWSALGSGLTGVIYDMSMCGPTVYAAGVTGVYYFDNGLDPDEWVALPSPGATVLVVDCLDDEVYAGGYFTDASSDEYADYIARYTGSSWDAVGAGFDGVVEALLVEQDGIFAGGAFFDNNDNDRLLNGIARWSLSRWEPPVEIDFSDDVHAIAVVGEDIYVGGDFTDVGSPNGDYLVRWDGMNWVSVGDTPLDGPVLALEPYGTGVVIGGDFTDADGDGTDDYNITYYDGDFHAMGTGLGSDTTGIVYDLLANGTDLYATGLFGMDGSSTITLNGIALWDGDSWAALGSGLGSTSVEGDTLAIYNDQLVVGGFFNNLGGSDGDYIVRWDDSAWQPLDSGLDGEVWSLVVGPDGLYAGGDFNESISRWDGSSWNSLDGGMISGTVYALAILGGNVIAGGNYLSAGGIYTATGIASWDGSAWHAMEGPFDDNRQTVYALKDIGMDLVAGGSFITAGGLPYLDNLAFNNHLVEVTPTSGLIVLEGGGTATLTVSLHKRPKGNVVINLASSDTTEGTVSPTPLIFTPANWATSQTATITGVEDAVDDDDVDFQINTRTSSPDPLFDGMDAYIALVTNTDDDTAGITVDPTGGLIVTEAGGTDTFTVVLDSEPTADVTIALSSSDLSEGTVSPVSLTFTSADWDTTQTVYVTGVDDADIDSDAAFPILTAAATSSDPKYEGLDTADVWVMCLDDDNTAPTAMADSYATFTGLPLVVDAANGVLANDSDAEGQTLIALLATGPTAEEGTLILNTDGSFTFTPAAGFTGTASFTYQAHDGYVGSEVVTVTIQVNPYNIYLPLIMRY